MNITIVNTLSGNIKSVKVFFEKNFKSNVNVVNYQDLKLDDVTILVIPGVGNFGHTGRHIDEVDNGMKIKDFYKSGKQIIGICLGAQLLTESSEEAPDIQGLGLIKGNCKSLVKHPLYQGRVPRVGWSGLKSDRYKLHSLYFVHSFYILLNLLR